MTYKSPFTFLPDEHMRMVGIIAYHCEALDLVVQGTLAAIMQHDFDRVGLLTNEVPFHRKIELLALYARKVEQIDNAAWKDIEALLKQIRKANDLRNIYVHAKWLEGATPDVPLRSVVRFKDGKLDAGDKPTPISELEEAAAFINAVGERVTKLLVDLLEANKDDGDSVTT